MEAWKKHESSSPYDKNRHINRKEEKRIMQADEDNTEKRNTDIGPIGFLGLFTVSDGTKHGNGSELHCYEKTLKLGKKVKNISRRGYWFYLHT